MSFELNPTIQYTPNRGIYIQKLTTDDIIKSSIILNTSGNLYFKANYYNVFDQYWMTTGVTEELVLRWQKIENQLQFYTNCLNFAVWASTSGLGISYQHFTTSSPLINSIMRFHLYYHVRRIIYNLGIGNEFNPKSINVDKQAYLNLCKMYGVNPDFDWRNEGIFSTHQGCRRVII